MVKAIYPLSVEGGISGKIYPLPVEGGCPKGRGLVEDERERSQPPALRATSFQRKEGECARNRAAISFTSPFFI